MKKKELIKEMIFCLIDCINKGEATHKTYNMYWRLNKEYFGSHVNLFDLKKNEKGIKDLALICSKSKKDKNDIFSFLEKNNLNIYKKMYKQL